MPRPDRFFATNTPSKNHSALTQGSDLGVSRFECPQAAAQASEMKFVVPFVAGQPRGWYFDEGSDNRY
jgi:hypothetical protein